MMELEVYGGHYGIAKQCGPLESQGRVDAWLFHCPGQSAGWDWYLLGICHLRDLPNGDKAEKKYDHMTHEVIEFALCPDHGEPDIDGTNWHMLTPVNFKEQVELPSDEAAVEMGKALAKAVVTGILWAEPPLSGQMEPWLTTVIQSSAHLRGEPHAL